MSEQGNIQADDWRNKEVFDSKKHKERLDYARGAALFAVLTVIRLGVFYLADKSLIGGYWTNIVSTVLGAVLTIVILDKRNDYRAEREFKERLILQMGSPDNTFAVEAVRLLRLKGWLTDGNLQKANLTGSNLQNADLRKTNLNGIHLGNANLQFANLSAAKLENSNLRNANLRNTNLHETYFAHTHLRNANLETADLSNANLEGASLVGANLTGSNLWNVYFSSETILPDGSHWTPGRDMREFTHPEEWASDQAAKHPATPGSA